MNENRDWKPRHSAGVFAMSPPQLNRLCDTSHPSVNRTEDNHANDESCEYRRESCRGESHRANRSKNAVILSEAKDLRPNPHRNRSVVDCTGAAPLRPMFAKIPATRPSCLCGLCALCGEPLLKPRNENQPWIQPSLDPRRHFRLSTVDC